MIGHTVLIVDDNAEARQKLRKDLEVHGWSILESSITVDASALAKQQAPDLIILNVSLPEVCGETVMKALKLEPITCAIPIIALTVTEMAVGPAHPWVAETIPLGSPLPVLLAKLHHALAKRKAQKPYVLVVDDEPDFVEILTTFLREGGCAASGALDGREAFEVVRTVQPDAILLDLDMPYVDGWEFLAKLKVSKALADIRVVILTGMARTPTEQQRGKAMGASAYLLKPCNLHDVLQAIQTALHE